MPWKPADAHRHKKGLSDKQARQWAHVANSALASCLADKRPKDKCEASAVRQANASVGAPKDKASVISDNITGNLIHGSGGILNPMRDGNHCECPKCGKKSSGKKPCAKRECPKCKVKLRKAKEGKKVDEKSNVTYKAIDGKYQVYKSGDQWRWLAVSNMAIEDKEKEIVTENAYDEAIAYAEKNNAYGELDLVHVDGTEIGDCDLMVRLGNRLIEGGAWRDSQLAQSVRQKIQETPDEDGVSIKFRFDPGQFDGMSYLGGVQIMKRAILPRDMAASYGTAIAAIRGGDQEMAKQLDEETKAALLDYGISNEQLAELVERQKSLPPEEENVVIKEGETEVVEEDETEVTEKQGVWNKVRKLIEDAFGKVETPEPETVKSDTAELPKAKTEVEPTNEEVQEMVEKRFAEFSKVVAKAVGEQVAVLKLAIEKVATGQQAIEARLAEAEKFVEDKVLERLAELPPVVKVRPTEVSVNTVEPITPAIQAVKSAQGALMDDIKIEVKRKTSTAQYEV